MLLKNNFVAGIMNKDNDERLLPKGQYAHAENIQVLDSEGSDLGAIENRYGNLEISNFGFNSIVANNAKTIGVLADDSNQKIYYFVTSDENDFVFEHDRVSNITIILLQSATGGVLNFSKDFLITGINKIINGDFEKDLLAWTDDRNPPRIINIERAKTYGADNFIEDDISLIKKPPTFAPEIQLNTRVTPNNYLEDRFLTFAYRYKYLDGGYSALSAFTNYAFRPEPFDLDFDTMENNGMVNSFNEVEITFNTGTERVSDIELVYRESNSTNINIIQNLNKGEENWIDNANEKFIFTNSKIYSVLPDTEINRLYDNVPLLAKAQDIVGNRIIFGNYVEGYDLEDIDGNDVELDYTPTIVSKDLSYTPLDYNVILAADINGTTTLVVDLNGIPLNKGVRLNFDVKLTSVTLDGSFSSVMSYVLTKDYIGAPELSNDPHFIYFVEEIMTDRFIKNNFITPPENSIDSNQGGFTNFPTVTQNLQIKAPTSTYLVDNTPDNGDDNPANTETVVIGWDFSDVTKILFREIPFDTSLKTNRSYEVGMIYLDPEGRSSTVLTDSNNTVYIPQDFSTFKNKLSVEIEHNPPVWADRYKFVIKQNREEYNTIYIDRFFEDRLYRWARLEGANRDKVKEGDTLIVKSDLKGTLSEIVKVRVLEVTDQPEDFILNNEIIRDATYQSFVDSGIISDLLDSSQEDAGLYMKVKPVRFNMDFDGTTKQFIWNTDFSDAASGQGSINLPTSTVFGSPNPDSLGGTLNENTGLYEDTPITSGTQIQLAFEVTERPSGGGGQVYTYNVKHTANGNHDNFQDWYESEIVDLGGFEEYVNYSFYRDPVTNQLQLRMTSDANFSPRMTGVIDITFNKGLLIFETEPIDADTEIFYETGETFTIENGFHLGNNQSQTAGQNAVCELAAFNCYVMGNGAESYRYKDLFNSRYLSLDLRPTTTSIEKFRSIRRYADITYSEPYNEETNINGLNEFNLARANYKDDLEKKYGSIQKLYTRDTDLVVFQEDKVSRVLFGKDVLFNADGTSNVTSLENVLGQDITYMGEYGISRNPESFAIDGSLVYFMDAKRGTPLRLSVDGISEINYGMVNYFKELFQDNLYGDKVGAFDPYFDQYVVSANDTGVQATIHFDEKAKGWVEFSSYIPDTLVGMNNEFFTFKGTQLYLHHVESVDRNTFYDVYYPSKVSAVINDEPSVIKNFKTLTLEGNMPWEVEVKAYVSDREDFIASSIDDNEFLKKEGIWYAYMRRNEDDSQFDSGAVYGLGNIISIGVNNLTFEGSNNSLCVGDRLYYLDTNVAQDTQPPFLGTISNISGNSIVFTDDILSTPNVGDFLFGRKDARIEGGNLKGYSLGIDLENNSTNRVELFAVSTEVFKSSYNH